MNNPQLQRKARGGRRQRKSFSNGATAEANKLMPSVSNTHAVLDSRKGFWEVRDTIERYDEGQDEIILEPVKDRSITKKSHMRLFPARPVKGIVLNGKQLDKSTGKMVETTDIKITKMSDTTLLIRGLPDQMPVFKRKTSLSKRIKVDSDAPLTRENLNVTLDLNPKIEMDLDEEIEVKPKSKPAKPVTLYKSGE